MADILLTIWNVLFTVNVPYLNITFAQFSVAIFLMGFLCNFIYRKIFEKDK